MEIGVVFLQDSSLVEKAGQIAVVIGAVLSPICVLVAGFLAYRTAQAKNDFDKSKSILELDHKQLSIEHKNLQIDHDKLKKEHELLNKSIEKFQQRLEMLGINETRILKEKESLQERLFECKQERRDLKKINESLTKQNLTLAGETEEVHRTGE